MVITKRINVFVLNRYSPPNVSTAKDVYETLSLDKFLSKMAESYPLISTHVVKSLLLFPSTFCVSRDSHPCAISRPNIVPNWL